MHLGAGDGRVETARHHKVFVPCHEAVAVVQIKRIHHAGPDLVAGAIVQFGDMAIARDAIDALEMVLVVERVIGTSLERGDVERKAHLVIGQQHPHAGPVGICHGAVGRFEFVEIANDHIVSPYLWN